MPSKALERAPVVLLSAGALLSPSRGQLRRFRQWPKRALCVVASLLNVWPAWTVAVRCTGSELPDTWETWLGRARCPLSLVPMLLLPLDS